MLNSIVAAFQAVEYLVSSYHLMAWSLKPPLLISNVVLFLRLVMASEVFNLLIQSASLSIAYFRAFAIEEYLEIGSQGGVVDKSGEGTASPGGVVGKYGDGSVSPGAVEEGEDTRELGDDTASPPPLSTPLSNY